MDNFKPTYLYIKQHEVTGLQYFGKTTRKNVEGYLGSGKHWKRHIRKHGTAYVKTTWYMLFTNSVDLTAFALKFSQDNDIVESKEWANLVDENGLDGGFNGSFNGCFKKGVRNSPATEFKKGQPAPATAFKKGQPPTASSFKKREGPCPKCGGTERIKRGQCKKCAYDYKLMYNRASRKEKEFNKVIFN